jgi:hypothetical protein
MTTTTPSHRRGVRPLSRFVLPPDGPRSGWPQQPRGPRGLLKWPLWKADSRIVRGGIRNSDDSAGSIRCPLCPRKRTLSDTTGMSALCHVWTAPELARLFFTFAGWSVQPCVRPVGAAHMTAGHNAFRGSGPGQKPAFEMHWHKWVVLIAGSTGSALRAVGPPNLHITP